MTVERITIDAFVRQCLAAFDRLPQEGSRFIFEWMIVLEQHLRPEVEPVLEPIEDRRAQAMRDLDPRRAVLLPVAKGQRIEPTDPLMQPYPDVLSYKGDESTAG